MQIGFLGGQVWPNFDCFNEKSRIQVYVRIKNTPSHGMTRLISQSLWFL